MNSTLVEDVQPWTNAKEQAKEPLSVIYINIINVGKIIGCSSYCCTISFIRRYAFSSLGQISLKVSKLIKLSYSLV